MKTVVLTSDNHSWLLRGFFHQWEKYSLLPGLTYRNDPLAVEVAGFTNPGGLPKNVPFISLGNFADYPINKWSDAVIKYLKLIPDDLVLILLEDYWLIRPIYRKAVYDATEFMVTHPNVARFDLTTDRLYSKEARFCGVFERLDLLSAKGQYSLSFQASIYRRKALLEMLNPGETPWQAELDGSYRLNQSGYDVVGSYQWPINYLIAMNKGKLDRTGGWMWPARTLTKADWNDLDKLGYTTNGEEGHNEHPL